MKKVFLILALASLCYSCWRNNYGYEYPNATISTTPVNFDIINSEYDDYNASLPTIGGIFPLCFSTNRNSAGQDFDVIYKLIRFEFSKETGLFDIEEQLNDEQGYLDVYKDINDATDRINTSYDEYGPYLVTGASDRSLDKILLYGNNESGDFDIKLTHNYNSNDYDTIVSIPFLNSSFDDYYPAFNEDSSQVFFCSNRNGSFSIFNVDLDPSISLLDRLYDDSPKTVSPIDILNSAQDDKCPFIAGDFMVFTSNRAGGFGGFDLYYSELINGKWSEPTNFGSEINTEYDEYRPIVNFFDNRFTNDLMIFSSNRPGGLGGFDLYYVGVDAG
jgi:hypothetical protein